MGSLLRGSVGNRLRQSDGQDDILAGKEETIMSGPRAYSSIIQDLLRDQRLPPLGPGTPNEDARAQLMALTNESVLAPHSIQDKNMAAACRAGLWLHHNYVDEAHTI